MGGGQGRGVRGEGATHASAHSWQGGQVHSSVVSQARDKNSHTTRLEINMLHAGANWHMYIVYFLVVFYYHSITCIIYLRFILIALTGPHCKTVYTLNVLPCINIFK